MNSDTFQRVMDGYADTPQERVLAGLLARDPDGFLELWVAMIDRERKPTIVDNWPGAQEIILVDLKQEEHKATPHPVRMSYKRRREKDDVAPSGFWYCPFCDSYKSEDQFAMDTTKPSLAYRNYRRAKCKECYLKD